MNILTDEELEGIKFSQRDQLVDLEVLRAVEAAVLSKLAEQSGVEPSCWMTPDGEGWRMRTEPPVNDVPLGWTAMYQETQLLAAQQRAAKALIEPMAKVIYRQWNNMPEYTAWVDGGNSFKQDDARRIARNVVVCEDWREYL